MNKQLADKKVISNMLLRLSHEIIENNNITLDDIDSDEISGMAYLAVNEHSTSENSNESSLGPITITITSDNILNFIDWIAPRRKKK